MFSYHDQVLEPVFHILRENSDFMRIFDFDFSIIDMPFSKYFFRTGSKGFAR